MRKLFIAFYIFLISIPILTIIDNTPNIFSVFSSIASSSYLFLRLFGLLGITLLFIQTILGSNMSFFIKTFSPGILKFHMTQGVIAYFIILSHPFLYAFYNFQTIGLNNAFSAFIPDFSSNYSLYILLGQTGLTLLTIAVLAAISRNNKRIIKFWIKIHRLNYAVFPPILFHSFLIGADTKSLPFIALYPVFIGGYLWVIIKKLNKQYNNMAI